MPQVTYTDEYVTVRRLRLHYVDYGGDGEVVIALPGLIQTARVFDAIAPIFRSRFHLLALDLPGRGESEWAPPACYECSEYLLCLSAFIAALRVKQVSLIGTSLGGVVARLYAMTHPDLVARLVLNDCAVGGNLAGVYRVAKRPSRAPREFADFSEALVWFQSERDGFDRLDDEARTSWVRHFLRPSPGGGFRFNCDPAIIRIASLRADRLQTPVTTRLVLSRQAVQWEHAKRLTMPVLLLRGAVSDVVLPEIAERLTQLLPRAQCVGVPGVGHCPTLYEPEAQNALIDFFASEQTALHQG